MRNRRWLWVAVLFLASLLGVLSWKSWPRENLLLKHAHKVADVSQWDASRLDKQWPLGHYWLNNDHVLFSLDSIDCRVLNADTGVVRASKAFTKAVADRDYYEINLSPNRKWIMPFIFHWDGSQVVEVNGSCHHELPREGRRIWLWDSRHYITWQRIDPDTTNERLDDPETPMECNAGEARIIVRNVRSPQILRRIVYRPTITLPPIGSIVSCPDRFILLEYIHPDLDVPKRTLTVVESGLGLIPRPDNKRLIHLPASALLHKAILSPQGDRIAFVFRFEPKASMLGWLHRFLPSIAQETQDKESLWISRIDGSDMQLVGHIPIHSEDDRLDNLQWLPDGKRLSFDYQDALYTVPAD